MILQALVNYYEKLEQRGDIAKPGYSYENVSYAINISENGELINIIPLKEEKSLGKKVASLPQRMKVPEHIKRASNVASNFLCDNSQYLLGIGKEEKAKRTAECFSAAQNLHLTILENVDGPAAYALRNFFKSWKPEYATQNQTIRDYYDDLLAGENLVFMVVGKTFAHEDINVLNAWDKYYQNKDTGRVMQCLVTGKEFPIERLHPAIKGIPGSQPAGASLVSFNEPAYASYGRDGEQGLNAPVSKYAAFAYGAALNYLLSDTKHRQIIGDMVVVFWADNADPVLQDWFMASINPNIDNDFILKEILKKAAAGEAVEEISLNTPFYILGLSPNAARVSVRFFLIDSFGNIINNIITHHERMNIIKAPYQKEYLSLNDLLFETVNPKSKNKSPSPLLSGSVLRAILTNAQYPESLYDAVIIRIRAEGNITRGRAAIIKAYLIKKYKEDISVSLNENCNSKPYVLGRLFSLLEQIQQAANPGINTTIKDRYFTSACTTPAVAFPNLLRLSSYHLSKLENKGLQITLNKELGKLMDKLDSEPFPSHLNLKEQGLFILGYYHQIQHRFTKKEEEEK